MDPSETFFSPDSDICQQLLDQYSTSSAVHHRHLCTTAASMRSILLDDSLPLSPLSYFAATITATSQSSDDAASVAALSTFLSLVLPLVPPDSILPQKAVEAVEILVGVLGRPSLIVTTPSARCLVKCLGVLVGFCGSSDWNMVKLPVETLLRFSMDKRPKVRKCAQICLENALKSFQSPFVMKKTSNLILSLLRSHMPTVVELSSLETKGGHENKYLSESDHLEIIHVLTIMKIAIPHLDGKISLEVVLQLLQLLNSKLSSLTGPVIETIEAVIRNIGVEVTSEIVEDTIAALSILKAYPKDATVSGANLLSTTLNVPNSEGTSDWISEWSNTGEGLSDSEPSFEDTQDDDLIYLTDSTRKLQIRKDASKARWDDMMGMAEVLERKGRMLISTGIVRNGKTYCLIEEALFLAEIGALIIVDDEGATLPLKDIYTKVAQGQSGCSWESFQVYRHLKVLGYIVGRHDVPWSLKSIKTGVNLPSQSLENDKVVQNACKEERCIVDLLTDLQINEGEIIFDVYLPNSKFRKSFPGNPMFAISLAGNLPPSPEEIEGLERQCKGIPLQFANVEHGRVTFFSFNKIHLSTSVNDQLQYKINEHEHLL